MSINQNQNAGSAPILHASKYGITPPISLSESSPEELRATESLIRALREAGQFESEEESRQREVVLGQLDKLVQEFVYKASLKKKYPEKVARECTGKIFTFGSYRLGVHGAGADIDTLCVVPAHVTREDFFDIMLGLLKERDDVEDLTPVPEAFVPVIKMEFSNVPIDLTFAALQLPKIPQDLELLDTNLLRNLDEAAIRSVNGSRVTDEVLRLVPDVKNFRLALRCIKQWAKKRAIYSNAMGFLGGIAWAMLVARVCQLYPNAASGSIVAKFFLIMCKWKWPQPVMLKPIEDGPLHVRVWNPRIYPQDKAHRMPIITPAYPSMCATHNVYQSALTIMTSEFKRGAEITNDIIAGKAEWNKLFEEQDFYALYKYYIQVTATSTDAETQHKIHGLVESTLRHFIMKLETIEQITLAHPNICSIEKSFKCDEADEEKKIRSGVFPEDGKESEDGKTTVYASQFYIGLVVDTTSGESGSQRLDISWPIQEYVRQVKKAEWWSEDTVLTIDFKRAHKLPSYVQSSTNIASKKSGRSSGKKKRQKPKGKLDEQKGGTKAEYLSTVTTAKKGNALEGSKDGTPKRKVDDAGLQNDVSAGDKNQSRAGGADELLDRSAAKKTQTISLSSTSDREEPDVALKSSARLQTKARTRPQQRGSGIKLRLAGTQ
ncbi:polynucleotide adenylyltransferase [Mycoemilia scoparia]|uniref:Poly(A) polymerase n=1 Tax=Mycoemilia scoparia TaxID=417184 RepID=A0A9W7ZYX8_9FUNG|nr:polynucleotide adenylyltransferase [Mycoemilia scoparia]